MKDVCSLPYLTYKPTKEEQKKIANRIMQSSHKLAYKRLKSGNYKVYCFQCDTYKNVTSDEFKQIQASKVCPACFKPIQPTTILDDTKVELIGLTNDKYEYGYKAVVTWQFGKQHKLRGLKQVLFGNNDIYYRKDIVKNMYTLVDTDTKGWKKCNGYVGYQYYFMELERRAKPDNITSKKEYYKDELHLDKLPLKSNQRKLIQDNLFNLNQIMYIRLFDLKTVEEVLKYKVYIRNNQITHLNVDDIKLNVYFLDYLSRNSIPIGNFVDYVRQCRQLKVKVDKPKDFERKHGEYSMLLLERKNRLNEAGIKKYAKKNMKHAYKATRVKIVPFETSNSILECAKEFHNCIGNYISSYAKGKTQLYHLDIDNKPVVAIEVKGNHLVQAYQKFNKEATKDQMKHIKRWCSQNKWTI